MIISFIAIPGAGKSTQIELLEKSNNFENLTVISVPSLYNRRKTIITEYLTAEEKETINSVKAESDLSRGLGYLAPFVLDKIILNLALRLDNLGKTVILDGCPRGIRQAELFLSMLSGKQKKQYKVIELCFLQNEKENSRDRQYIRTINNSNLSIEEAIKKIVKIPNKIKVYLEDTKVGLEYMKEQGINAGKVNACLEIDKCSKIILDFLK